jgi:hypothetical protein
MYTVKILRKLLFSVIIVGGINSFFCQNVNAQSERAVTEERKQETVYHPEPSEKMVKSETVDNSGYAPDQKEIGNKRNNKYREHKFSDTEISEKGNDEMSTLSFNIFLYVLDRFKEE